MDCDTCFVPAENRSLWKDILFHIGAFDIYHLPEYHSVAQRNGEGEPFLLYFVLNKAYFAIPLLIRPLSEVQGLEESEYFDATSVYGYSGVLTSLQQGESIRAFYQPIFIRHLKDCLKSKNIITLFTRQNPLLPNSWLFNGATDVITLGQTVAIDLSLPEEKQLKGMSKGHRYDIRKARKSGLSIWRDEGFKYINEFIRIYNYTMDKNIASNYYYFSKEYYSALNEILGDAIQLYFASKGNEIISGSIFMMTNQIIQYHLSGSLPEALSLNAPKVIIDEIRRWGTQQSYKWLHLGGGVGARKDALFQFKSGFSKLRFPYQVIKMVTDSSAYEDACSKRIRRIKKDNLTISDDDYFPLYRAPVKEINGYD